MPTIDRPAHIDDVEAVSVAAAHYVAPDWFTSHLFNPIVSRCTHWGISIMGSRVLCVPGRFTGETRATPVNVLEIDDRRFLVAPRGTTQWVLNVRSAGGCELCVGRRSESVRASELADLDKPLILRSYLRRWKWEVGQFFDGVGPGSTGVRRTGRTGAGDLNPRSQQGCGGASGVSVAGSGRRTWRRSAR